MNRFFLGIIWTGILSLLAAQAAAGAAPELPLWGVALDGNPLSRARLAEVESHTGLPFQMVVFFLQWPANPEEDNFPGESLAAIQARGAIPCLTWEPVFSENNRPTTVSWQRILAGEYDPYLIAFARRARDWGHPLIIRFAHEMNLETYHWGTPPEGYGPESPLIYQRIYRHVVELFRKEGAGQVLWAFAPNSESVPPPALTGKNSWNRAASYYPGHDYVDLLGMDGYNWGPAKTLSKDGWQSRWQSFAEIFGPLYAELRDIAPGKPIMVFEMSSTAAGGGKEEWLAEALLTAKSWQLAALVWFEVDKEQDWRLARGLGPNYPALLRKNTATHKDWLLRLIKRP